MPSARVFRFDVCAPSRCRYWLLPTPTASQTRWPAQSKPRRTSPDSVTVHSGTNSRSRETEASGKVGGRQRIIAQVKTHRRNVGKPRRIQRPRPIPKPPTTERHLPQHRRPGTSRGAVVRTGSRMAGDGPALTFSGSFQSLEIANAMAGMAWGADMSNVHERLGLVASRRPGSWGKKFSNIQRMAIPKTNDAKNPAADTPTRFQPS